MFSVSLLGGLVLLAFVIYEVQNVFNSFIFAMDWPSEARLERTAEGLKVVKGDPLTFRDRMTMAGYRLSYDSLLLHELHSFRMRKPPVFKTIPSFAFGSLAMVLATLNGMEPRDSAYLGLCALAVLFVSSQTRSFMRFHEQRNENTAQVSALLKSMEA